MSLQSLDLTTALRPELLPDETVLFISDGVGLYEGKYKLPEQQDGSAYLTSHRICYVDTANPRKCSVALQLKDIERHEFYAGFLKSSAKVTLFPRSKRASTQNLFQRLHDGRNGASAPLRSNNSSPAPGNGGQFDKPNHRVTVVNWVCPICSYSNPLPIGFDPVTVTSQTPVPPCQTCGIKPEIKVLTKAAISAARSSSTTVSSALSTESSSTQSAARSRGQIECPKCTFSNHPSLSSCEICGSTLPSVSQSSTIPSVSTHDARTSSPGPFMDMSDMIVDDQSEPHCIKLSFRSGGEKTFYERLKGAMTQKKWLLAAAPLAPTPQSLLVGSDSSSRSGAATPETRSVGIAGLERRGLEKREQAGSMLNTAFSDLESLMASAKEIIALAETMSGKSNESAADIILREQTAALEMKMSRDQFGSGSSAEMGYLKQLARVLADYLTNDAIGALRKSGGIMNLVDLYADWSKSNEGKDSASPDDFARAARLWETLGLPLRLRTFKNGVIVVQSRDRTDDATVGQILDWINGFKSAPPEEPVLWNWQMLGRGVSVVDVAERFGWTVGVAIEELEMAEDRGTLVREEGIEGLRFWLNVFPDFEDIARAEASAGFREGVRIEPVMSDRVP